MLAAHATTLHVLRNLLLLLTPAHRCPARRLCPHIPPTPPVHPPLACCASAHLSLEVAACALHHAQPLRTLILLPSAIQAGIPDDGALGGQALSDLAAEAEAEVEAERGAQMEAQPNSSAQWGHKMQQLGQPACLPVHHPAG